MSSRQAKTQPEADQPSSWLSQARKERTIFISPNLGALCAFARDIGISNLKIQISLASFSQAQRLPNTDDQTTNDPWLGSSR
jgi:hypothetical protein